jgi:isopenicillin-N epimerase
MTLNRRSFLSSSFASTFASSLAVGAGPSWRGNLWAQLESMPSKLPERSLFEQNEDAYWRELRKQFLIPADEIYLNNGTVGSSPAPVLRAVFEVMRRARSSTRRIPKTIPSGDTRRGTSFAIRWLRLSAATATRSRCSEMPPKPIATSPMALT